MPRTYFCITLVTNITLTSNTSKVS